MLKIAAFLVVTILPGAWISFSLPLRRLPFWARFLLGVLLAPLVLALEFFPLRLLGASFERTALLLVFVNLPALLLIWRHARRVEAPHRYTWLTGALVVAICLACLAAAFVHPQQRMYLAHPWVYSEPIYSLAKGELNPEDPELAGTAMEYPLWGSLIQQAIQSYLLDSPPMWNFIWSNLAFLIVIAGFTVRLVEELGGGWIAKWSSAIWLLLAANSVGYVLERLLPHALVGAFRIWGDARYTPWVWKYYDFNTMPLVLGMCAALAYLLIRHFPDGLSKDFLLVVFLLLSCIGVFYPILYPAACALLGARALAVLLEKPAESRAVQVRQIATLAIVLLLSGVATYANFKFVSAERVVHGMVQISNLLAIARKGIQFVVVTSPLLLGAGLVFLQCWKEKRAAFVVLGLGALGSLFLNAVFFLPYWENEYKFVFTAVICLAPFASLATEQLWKKLGPAKALPIAGLALLFFVGAFAHQLNTWNWQGQRPRAMTDASSFHLRLAPIERLSGIYEALRLKTPPNTIVAIQNPDWHPPTFTNRSLYVPYENRPFSGMNQGNDTLLAFVRGKGLQIVNDRRQTLVDLYEAPEERQRAQALNRILQMNRPFAIVLEPQNAALLDWLKANTHGAAVFEQNGLTLWLIEPSAR